MSSPNASNFKIHSLEKSTRLRVKLIMKYIIHCYLMMIKEGRTYSKSESLNSDNTKYNLEEYLSEKLVEDYLGIWNNIQGFFNSHTNSNSTFITFNYEPKQAYIENGTRKDDFIDIKINDSVLSTIMSEVEQRQVHFSIECKILKNGYSEYVSDITKMSSRNFEYTRLPFEGQIGYVLNKNYTHQKIVDGITQNLANSAIQTTQHLIPIEIHDYFEASYHSTHKRNHGKKEDFSILHLFFNYSEVVV